MIRTDPMTMGTRLSMLQFIAGMFLALIGFMVYFAISFTWTVLCWSWAFACFQSAFIIYVVTVQNAQIVNGRNKIVKVFQR